MSKFVYALIIISSIQLYKFDKVNLKGFSISGNEISINEESEKDEQSNNLPNIPETPLPSELTDPFDGEPRRNHHKKNHTNDYEYNYNDYWQKKHKYHKGKNYYGNIIYGATSSVDFSFLMILYSSLVPLVCCCGPCIFLIAFFAVKLINKRQKEKELQFYYKIQTLKRIEAQYQPNPQHPQQQNPQDTNVSLNQSDDMPIQNVFPHQNSVPHSNNVIQPNPQEIIELGNTKE